MADSLSSIINRPRVPTQIFAPLSAIPVTASLYLNGERSGYVETGAVSVGAVQNQWYTLISDTGHGILQAILGGAGGTTLSETWQARFIIDNVQVWISNAETLSTNDLFQVVGHWTDPSDGGVKVHDAIPFNSSFSFEMRNTGSNSAQNLYGFYRYYLT